jgi:DNA-binding IclR family transcriptional regulator
MTYRMVGTLAKFGFVQRTPAGKLELGLSLTVLSKGVSKSLQNAAAPELSFVADTLGMTAFLVIYDGEAAVTISNTEPQNATSTVAKKPGSRHPIDQGAPGKVIRSQVFPDKFPPKEYEYSQNEVLPGLAAIAVPLKVLGMEPAALAVLFLPQAVDKAKISSVLTAAAERIVASVGG